MLCGLWDGRQVRQGTRGGHKSTSGMSLLNVLEGQTGGTAAAVLHEEVLHTGKATVELKNRHAVEREIYETAIKKHNVAVCVLNLHHQTTVWTPACEGWLF